MTKLAKERRERIKRIGVPLWQEDLWKEIIRAAESDAPDQTKFMDMPGFDAPAASPYAATTPELLAWFKGYNERHPEGKRIFPFGFLLSLQAKSRLEMAQDEPEALSHDLWQRREPRPAAPYFKRAIDAKDHAFDRERDAPIPASWLKSHGRSLVRYHLHQESKFWGGEYDQRGPLRRRHVRALSLQPIGKESDNIEENEFIGEEAGPLEHPMELPGLRKLAAFIVATLKEFGISDRELTDRAGASPHTLRGLKAGRLIASEFGTTTDAGRRRTAPRKKPEYLGNGQIIGTPALASRQSWEPQQTRGNARYRPNLSWSRAQRQEADERKNSLAAKQV